MVCFESHKVAIDCLMTLQVNISVVYVLSNNSLSTLLFSTYPKIGIIPGPFRHVIDSIQVGKDAEEIFVDLSYPITDCWFTM